MKTNTKVALAFVSGMVSTVLAVTIVNGVKDYFTPTPEFVNMKASLAEELELPVEEIKLYRYDMDDSKWFEVCPDINQYIKDYSIFPGCVYTLKESDSAEVVLGVTWRYTGSSATHVDRMYFNGKSAINSIVYDKYISAHGDTTEYLVKMDDVPIEVETADICRAIDIECNKHLG